MLSQSNEKPRSLRDLDRKDQDVHRPDFRVSSLLKLTWPPAPFQSPGTGLGSKVTCKNENMAIFTPAEILAILNLDFQYEIN